MSLALSDLQTYLSSNGFTNVQLNRMQDEPAQAIAVSSAGGSEPVFDGAFESTHIHIRVRDVSDALAETTALNLHAFMSSHEQSFQIGTTYVLTIVPSSGPPQYFDRDVDNRTTYMISYQFTVAV